MSSRTAPSALDSRTPTFPILTAPQIARIAARGHVRPIQRGDVLVEQGDKAGRFFVVTAGGLEVLRPSGPPAPLLTLVGPRPFTGEGHMISRPPAPVRLRATQPGGGIGLERAHALAV